MSDFQPRDNSGTLFKNDRAESERHPGYTGKALIDGVEYRVSAWVKEGRNGKFFSLAFTPKDQQQERRQEPSQGSQQGFSNGVRTRAPGEHPMPPTGGSGRRKPIDIEDDIPFAAEVR